MAERRIDEGKNLLQEKDFLMKAAAVAEETGQMSKALKICSKVLSLNPNFIEAQLLSAKIYSKIGQLESAESKYREILSLNPNCLPALIGLGALFVKDGRASQAIPLTARAIGINPNERGARFLLARALLDDDQPEAALKTLQEILTIESKSGEIYAKVGSALQQFGFMEEAEAALLEAIRLDPQMGVPYYHLVQGRKIQSQDDSIFRLIQQSLGLPGMKKPDLSSINFALGKAYDDLRRYEHAMEHYQEANALALEEMERKGRRFNSVEVDRQFQRAMTSSSWLESSPRGSDSEAPVFVIGMMRSGTTLLEQILSRHSQIAAVGELDFWLQVSDHFQSSGFPPNASQTETIAARYLSTHRMNSLQTKFIDKMPHNFLSLATILTVFPQAKIIHCRRKLIASSLSIYTTPFQNPPDFGHSRENIAYFALHYQRLMEHWREVLRPNQMLEVDYESLIANPQRSVREVLQFLGVEWQDKCLEHGSHQRCVSTPSLWQVRQPLYKSSVERWRNYQPWLGPLTQLIDPQDLS